MGIFKQTLAQGIQDQLKARTNVVKGNRANYNRNTLLPYYLSKNSWVRMSSMVNYTSGDIDFDGKGIITTTSDGNWKDADLSKRYILEGGTLYTKKNGNDIESALRKDVVREDGAYGGDFDVMGNGQADPQYTRQFGIRPMPGITSVNLHTQGAYGSIFETTIKFYAWDSKQLSDLELLFMRPGYSVLLEWGWSQYITNDNNTEVWPGLSLDPFKSQTQQEIYNKLQAFREKYDYNYDGMLGYIKNFNWNLMPNGGYDCSTTLISMGEVINSLKISTNNIKKPSTPNFDLDRESKPVYDDWEKILISLKATAEGIATTGSQNNNIQTISNEDNNYFGKWNYDEDYIPRDKIQTELKKYNFDSASARLNNQPLVKSIKTGNDEKPEGNYYEYLSLDVVMAMMDSYFNFNVGKDELSTDKMVKIIPPGTEDYCLAGRDSISVDPSVCIVGNRHAFVEEFTTGLNPLSPKHTGVVVPIKKTIVKDGKPAKSENWHYTGDFYNDELKVGLIGNIYVNISLLLDTYKQHKNTANDDGVNFTSYMKSILNKISNSLGGLNNFVLSTAGRDQNTLRIVDTYYLEKDGNKKYELDIMGLGSICRETNIRSEIFPEQATMVAIAAQSRANLGDIYNSTQAYLNAGLQDRVALAKEQPNETKNDLDAGTKDNPFYQKLLDFLLHIRDYVVGDPNDENLSIQTQSNGHIPTTFLKQFMLKYNGELNFKALIPFKLTIKLDGIGGIIVGEVFKIKQNILPKNYYDKNLGFVITKISHDLSNNDWETTLETQICILDNISLGKEYLKIQRQGFGEYMKIAAKEAIIYPAIINFAVYQALKSFIILIQAVREEGGNVYGLGKLIEVLKAYSTPKAASYYNDYIKTWKNQITTLNNWDKSNNDGLVGEYGINQLDDWLDSYNNVFLDSLTTEQKSQKVDDETTLLDAVNGSISQFELINEIQSKFNDNINMFAEPQIWNGVFEKSLDVRLKENNGKNLQVFDYVRLIKNIESELVSRGILTNTFQQQYYKLPLIEKTLQPEINPIESKIFYGDQNSLYQRFYVYQIVTNYIRGDFQYNMKVSDKPTVKEYYDIIPDPLIGPKEFLNEIGLFNKTYLNF